MSRYDPVIGAFPAAQRILEICWLLALPLRLCSEYLLFRQTSTELDVINGLESTSSISDVDIVLVEVEAVVDLISVEPVLAGSEVEVAVLTVDVACVSTGFIEDDVIVCVEMSVEEDILVVTAVVELDGGIVIDVVCESIEESSEVGAMEDSFLEHEIK